MARRSAPHDPSIGERIKARRQMRGWSIRYAADRAGIHNTTWMRIEKGEMRTDRYMIAEIAAALECAVVDLTGQPYAPGDRASEAAQSRVPALWLAMVETAPDEPPTRPQPTLGELESRVELLDMHRTRSDYAAVTRALPDLLLDLHAAANGGDARSVMRMLVDCCNTARGTLRGLGRPAEAMLAADRCREWAEVLEEPVALGVASWARANAASGSGAYRRSLTLSTRATDELELHLAADGALPVLGMLHLSSSLALVRSDPAAAFAHLGEAEQLAQRTGETRQWWMFFGPANVGIWRMGAMVDAGLAGRAVELAQTLHVGELESADRRATYYLELARGLSDFDGNRDTDAVKALLAAERLAPQRIRSYTAARSTARFLLDRSNRSSALHGLCERMGVAD